ncbi:predicted glycosyltransferase [Chthonomonas calidirosea]|uniref:glycosyltransferase family 2 protein n=2 Tax=Chthonomonas calidirosea TaxID=454171 RepID=UPI0006DD3E9F|nr:glycosyltransferase family 2 protein [Chthonomonas calidirosea]CEK12661.1 predicted glycosyltransferase [Chthonomonas calidirosea]
MVLGSAYGNACFGYNKCSLKGCDQGYGQELSLCEITLSIVIVSWNTRDLLLRALESIYAAPPPFPFEVIVVDNASVDGTVAAVQQAYPQVILLPNAVNNGYAKGNNQGIERARGAYILLLNPDVLLPKGGLEKAVRFMEQHPEAGAIGVRQVHPDGTLERSVRGFPTPLGVLWELIGLSRLFPKNRFFGAYRMTWFTYDKVAEVDQPMGTFLMLRRQAVEQVGMLDEGFPIFFNEVDWCLRCKRKGWKIYFTPEVEIVHYGGASTSQVAPAMAWESRRGLLRFYARHYGGWVYAPLRLLVALLSWPYAWWQARQRRQRVQQESPKGRT